MINDAQLNQPVTAGELESALLTLARLAYQRLAPLTLEGRADAGREIREAIRAEVTRQPPT